MRNLKEDGLMKHGLMNYTKYKGARGQMIDLNENTKKLENLKKRLYEMGDSL